jgi:cell division protein FtsB
VLDFHQKRKLRVLASSRWILGIFSILVVLVLVSAFTRYQMASEMAERRELEEVTVQTLEKRKNDLEKQVQYLSDERGIEAEMRRQFDVALEGEQVVVIVDPEVAPRSTPVVVEVEPAWYQFWR